MQELQRTTTGMLLMLALVTSITGAFVLLTPSSAYAMCGCEEWCEEAGCCSAQGICAQCDQEGCCVYDDDPCLGGQLISCVYC